MESAAPEKVLKEIGLRLAASRTGITQPGRAAQLGVHKNTYARWERGEAEIGAVAMAQMVKEGWNANWLLIGEGPHRLEALDGEGCSGLSGPAMKASHPVRLDPVKLAEASDAVEAGIEALGIDLTSLGRAGVVATVYQRLVSQEGSAARLVAFVLNTIRESSHAGE